MLFLREAWLPAIGAVIALFAPACGDGGTAGTAGTGMGGSASTSSSVIATTGTATGGGGGGATTGSTSSAGGSIAYAPSGYACSGKTPSLTHDVVAITSGSCTNGPSCHAALHTANGVKDMFVNRLAEECGDGRLMVKPGDPEGSYVIHKITKHNLCAMQPAMPQVGAPLSADQVQTIYDWICQGAPSN